MAHKIEGKSLIIGLNLNSTERSSTGKTYLLASSHGYQEGEVEIDGKMEKIGISYNITRKIAQ